MASFLTIAEPSEGQVREKMSRFLAFAAPVASVDGAMEFVASIANRYHDARHVCWAYMIGADRTIYRSNDNGEPSGTAGKPILGQINSLGLTNIAVAVVRYFGGIKLGTSGLIVAYREATRQALEAATIVEGQEMSELGFTFPYMAMNAVMALVKGNSSIRVVSQSFDNTCLMRISLPSATLAEIIGRLNGIDGVSLTD